MQIKLYNTLTKKIEEFVPRVPGAVGFYSCGPTVYHFAHIGNLRKYIHDDIMERMFRANGYAVKHITNITDVGHLVSDGDDGEDKMEKGSRRENKSVWDIAKLYTDAFMADMADLNILQTIDNMPRATNYIAEQIAMVQRLEELGYTYKTSDGIYYDTARFANYGELFGGNIGGNRAGARVEFSDEKRNAADFALWKFSPVDEQRQMEWPSPWGTGFPGWHIECSAMSRALLGDHFDIHTGGIDHIPVHHTNEIAQSQPIVGRPWVNYWVHFEFLVDQNQTGKMSKSKGEFITLGVLTDRGFDPMHYRYLILMGHFQSQIVFSWEILESAKNGYNRIVENIHALLKDAPHETPNMEQVAEWREKILAPVNDNMHTAESLQALRDMLKDDSLNAGTKREVLEFADKLLGLDLWKHAQAMDDIPDEIHEKGQQWHAAKCARDFATSDKIRDDIAASGYQLRETKNGYELIKA